MQPKPWPYVRPRGDGTLAPRTQHRPVPRSCRAVILPGDQGSPIARRTYSRVRQHLFTAHAPVTAETIADRLDVSVKAVRSALTRLAGTGRVRVADGDTWVFIRHTERVVDGR